MDINLTTKELAVIADKCVFTKHAKQRLIQRGSEELRTDFGSKVKKSQLAWRTVEHEIKIKVERKVLVVAKKINELYLIITVIICKPNNKNYSKKAKHKTLDDYYKDDSRIWGMVETKKLLAGISNGGK